jgi:hypothetical protein
VGSPQLCANALAQHLPGNDIGVVLHLGDDDVIARVNLRVAPAVGDQVDPFGVPRTNTSSSGERALRAAICVRTFSIRWVASALSV